MHACIYIHARLATQSNGSPMRARCTHAPTCCVRARARACVIGRTRIRADTCERLPSASNAGGFARRRSTRRRHSTPTSARGTPPRSPRCPRYAPPLRPGRRWPLCAAGPSMRARARVRSRVGTRMRGVSVSVGIAARTKDRIYDCLYTYIHTCMYMCISMDDTYT